MDTLKNKKYYNYNYTSRYTPVPYYFDTLENRETYGLGSNLSKTTESVSHLIKDGDTLDYLALKYYNNPTYWWVIAYFNDIQDALTPLSELYAFKSPKVIQIPAISSIEFGDEK